MQAENKNKDFFRDLGATVLFAAQGACIAGFSSYVFGRVFSMGDPIKSAIFASKTAGCSILIGLGAGSCVYNRWAVSGNSKDNDQENMERTGILVTAGFVVTVISFLYHRKEFPLLNAIAYTAAGALGSIGAFLLNDEVVKLKNKIPFMDTVWVIQGAATAGITALFTSNILENAEPSKVLEFASKTAGFSVLIGLGVGALCDKLVDKRQVLKEKPYLVILGGALATTASFFYHKKQFSLLSAVVSTAVGVLGSKVAYEIADQLLVKRDGRPPEPEDKDEVSIREVVKSNRRK